MKTKICGIRNENDAVAAIKARADAIGFLVGITHIAEDKISLSDAKSIIDKYSSRIHTVMVTHLQDEREILEMAYYLQTTVMQLHDYVPPEIIRNIKAQLPSVFIIKALHVTNYEETMKQFEEFKNSVDALLLDSVSLGRIGGTGLTHDWRISGDIVKLSPVPVVLAGGLNPDNVAEAVQKVQPYGIDVNSGVEINGYKSTEKIRKLIHNANMAERKK